VIDDSPPLQPRSGVTLNGQAAAASASAPIAAGVTSNNSNAVVGVGEETVDTLCHRTQMKLIMDRNRSKTNPDSIDASIVESVLGTVMSQKSAILAKVESDKPELLAVMKDALDAPFSREPGKRISKYNRVEKLVDIWMVFKEIDSLLDSGRATRSTSLATYVDLMKRFDMLAREAVQDSVGKFKAFKSEKMPPGEAERLYLQGGGIRLDEKEYPCCPNKKCRHNLFDGAPGNATVDADNAGEMKQYMELCQAVTAYRRKEGPQPMDPATNKPLDKNPPAPKPKKKYGRCHCRQNYADARNGKQCPIGCKVGDVVFPLGKCPLCKCPCNIYIPLDQYRSIVTASTLGETQRQNDQAAAQNWLNQSLNVNSMQQSLANDAYQQMIRDGTMAPSSSITNNLLDQGALAQSLSMFSNPPSHSTVLAIRQRVDAMQHESGPSFTEVGDMNTHGRASAADKRMTNNGLLAEHVPPGMSDDQMMQAAMTASVTENAFSGDASEEDQLQIAMMESNEQASVEASRRVSKLESFRYLLPTHLSQLVTLSSSYPADRGRAQFQNAGSTSRSSSCWCPTSCSRCIRSACCLRSCDCARLRVCCGCRRYSHGPHHPGQRGHAHAHRQHSERSLQEPPREPQEHEQGRAQDAWHTDPEAHPPPRPCVRHRAQRYQGQVDAGEGRGHDRFHRGHDGRRSVDCTTVRPLVSYRHGDASKHRFVSTYLIRFHTCIEESVVDLID